MDAGAKKLTTEMKLAAAYAIANEISDDELNEENIIPKPFKEGVAMNVAEAVLKEVK